MNFEKKELFPGSPGISSNEGTPPSSCRQICKYHCYTHVDCLLQFVWWLLPSFEVGLSFRSPGLLFVYFEFRGHSIGKDIDFQGTVFIFAIFDVKNDIRICNFGKRNK